MRLMASHAGISVKLMENKISKFDYSSSELATYLVLSKRKELYGAKNFRIWGIKMEMVFKI